MFWSEHDDRRLRDLYPRASWDELRSAFSDRTVSSIYKRVHRLGIVRQVVDYTSPEARERARAWSLTGNARRGTSKVIDEVRGGVEGRVCNVCTEWKPIEKFGRHRDCAGGRRLQCTTCEGRRAYRNDPDASIRSVRNWQKNHPEHARALKRAGNRKRHDRKVEGPGVSVDQVRDILEAHDFRCAYCGGEYETLDHVVALARGGLHAPENIVPACKRCNFKKKTKSRSEFLVQLWR